MPAAAARRYKGYLDPYSKMQVPRTTQYRLNKLKTRATLPTLTNTASGDKSADVADIGITPAEPVSNIEVRRQVSDPELENNENNFIGTGSADNSEDEYEEMVHAGKETVNDEVEENSEEGKEAEIYEEGEEENYDEDKEADIYEESEEENYDENEAEENMYSSMKNDDFPFHLPCGSPTLPCPITATKEETILMILGYAFRHHLSGVAVSDLFKLMNSIFGRKIFPCSRYLFHSLLSKNSNIEHHAYCYNCNIYFGKLDAVNDITKCPTCNVDMTETSIKEKGSYFLMLDLKTQFQMIFNNEELQKKILQLSCNLLQAGKLSDISDGTCFKNVKAQSDPDKISITLTFSTDGFPLHKSTNKSSMWPIMMVINELPHSVRYKHMLLTGLWFGGEPKMHIYLNAFTQKIEQLNEISGLKCGNLLVEILPICCCVDTVARPTLQNSTQFNGHFGCSWCLHPGYMVEGTMKYPIRETWYEDRVERQTRQEMINATRRGLSIQGIKGPTPLMRLPFFDVVWGFSPDYMHCVLLGVCKLLLSLWLESTSTNYYLGSPINKAILTNRLMNIKVPVNIQRLPRGIEEWKHWKASEFRNWLLFYSVPCLGDLLPTEFLEHYSLMVKSIFLLLQTHISCEEIDEAEDNLITFVFKFKDLYGEPAMNYNVHQLVHLAKSVRKWGPLWAHSMFAFEGWNGHLRNLVTGNTMAPVQMAQRYMLFLKLRNKINMSYNVSENVLIFWKQLYNESTELKIISKQRTPFYLSSADMLQQQIQSLNLDGAELFFAKKIIVEGVPYCNKICSKNKRIDNTVVKLKNGLFGYISEICIIQKQDSSQSYYFVINNFVTESNGLQISRDAVQLSHIKKIIGVGEAHTLVQLADISCKVIKVDVANTEYSYVCDFPNLLDHN